MQTASTECEPVWLKSEEPLFILYTSGSTGKPKVLCCDKFYNNFRSWVKGLKKKNFQKFFLSSPFWFKGIGPLNLEGLLLSWLVFSVQI